MANEEMREQNVGTDPKQGKEQDKGKAMGAGATSGTQGQRRGEFETQSESPEQGGGIQGTGQRNPNPTQGKAGQETKGSGFRDEEPASKRNPEQEEY